MKYYVTYAISAYYVAEVEADSLEEAREKAGDKYYEADFGDATDIDADQVIVEDEDDNILWGHM
jgi:phosphomannomutase